MKFHPSEAIVLLCYPSPPFFCVWEGRVCRPKAILRCQGWLGLVSELQALSSLPPQHWTMGIETELRFKCLVASLTD